MIKPKTNTRLFCSTATAFFGVLAVGLPKLDPNNYWLALAGLLAAGIAAGTGTVVTFYEKLINENKD